MLIQILSAIYGAVGVIGVIAYFSTIKDLYQERPSANIVSYGMWTLTTLVTLLYSVFVVQDVLFQLISLLNFFSCVLILGMCFRLNIKK